MDLTEKELRELEKKVAARKKQFIKYLKFVDRVLDELGSITHRDESSDHTKVKKELKNFNGFNFHGTFGMTYCGGNVIAVNMLLESGLCLSVFRVYWQSSIEEFEVEYLEKDDLAWQKMFDGFVARPDKVITRFKTETARENAKAEAAAEKKKKDQQRQEYLKAEADAFGIV